MSLEQRRNLSQRVWYITVQQVNILDRTALLLPSPRPAGLGSSFGRGDTRLLQVEPEVLRRWLRGVLLSIFRHLNRPLTAILIPDKTPCLALRSHLS